MTIEIVKDRPLHTVSSRAKWTDYPLATMSVGDAFFLEQGTFERKKLSVMLNSVGKRLTKGDVVVKFSTRSENGGIWVQRVS